VVVNLDGDGDGDARARSLSTRSDVGGQRSDERF
jgi:hypothetical protein